MNFSELKYDALLELRELLEEKIAGIKKQIDSTPILRRIVSGEYKAQQRALVEALQSLAAVQKEISARESNYMDNCPFESICVAMQLPFIRARCPNGEYMTVIHPGYKQAVFPIPHAPIEK